MIRFVMRWAAVATINMAVGCGSGPGARHAPAGARLGPANRGGPPATPGTVADATRATPSRTDAGASSRPDPTTNAVQVAGDTPRVPLRISATTLPARPLIERRTHSQRLNFDLMLRNDGTTTAEVARIEIWVRDRSGKLALRRFIDASGFQPALATTGKTRIAPGQTLSLFNPFHDLDPEIDAAVLTFEIALESDDGAEQKIVVNVAPQELSPAKALTVPMPGRVLVFDGHDYLGHHRRLDVNHPVVSNLGIRLNFMRYANDLCIVDEAGALFRGDGNRNEDWYSFGAPIVSPRAGTVVAAESNVPDNLRGKSLFDPKALDSDLMALFGNRIVIDHGDGQFSLLAHLQRGSVAVRVGDRVKAGQVIAKAGASGDAYIPHLHYELRSSAGADGEGLPAYFERFRRVLGGRSVPVRRQPMDSGEIVLTP